MKIASLQCIVKTLRNLEYDISMRHDETLLKACVEWSRCNLPTIATLSSLAQTPGEMKIVRPYADTCKLYYAVQIHII